MVILRLGPRMNIQMYRIFGLTVVKLRINRVEEHRKDIHFGEAEGRNSDVPSYRINRVRINRVPLYV